MQYTRGESAAARVATMAEEVAPAATAVALAAGTVVAATTVEREGSIWVPRPSTTRGRHGPTLEYAPLC